VTLLELVKAGLDVFSARTKSVTFKVLVDETLGAKLHRSTFYAERLRYVAGQFASINDKLVSDITPVDLEPTFAELRSRPATYNSAVRHLKVFFSYGKAMRYLQENPLTGRSIIEKPGDEVEVIPHHLVEAMLADALVNQLDLLPYLVFGFFCGIRPTGELRKLYWRNVDWEEREITVTSKASKTWQTRHIKISDNAIAWLERYQELGGSVDPEKEIVPFTYYQQRDRRAECWERISQGADWVQDGMRHTFASNHYALHKDINLICLQLGHSSPKMLDAHYRKGVKPKEAEIFWQIYPPANLEKKVVAFAAA
jgi:integrase